MSSNWKQWYPKQKPYCVVVLTEEHLPQKWLREIKDTVPLSFAATARSPGQVTKFIKETANVNPNSMCLLVLPKSMAKLGSGWTGAWMRKLMHGRWLYGCPRCGGICQEEDEEGHSTFAVTDERWFTKKKRYCSECREPLWQMVRLKKHKPFIPPLDRTPMGWMRNPPPVRYPLAEFILRQYKGFFNLAIIDEAHRYNAESTDQVYAYRALVRAVTDGIVEATASTFNGRASSLFTRLHTLNPEIRQQFAWTERQDFAALYGKLERRMQLDDRRFTYGYYTGRKRQKTIVKELPAVSPSLVPILLANHVFLNLDDLGAALPEYREECVPLDMPDSMRAPYSLFDQECLGAIRQFPRIVGGWLQATLAWPNAPWNQEVVQSKLFYENGTPILNEDGTQRTQVISTINPIDTRKSSTLWPKEEWLMEIIQENTSSGRGVGVYLQHVHNRALPERLQWIISEMGIKAVILPQSVGTQRREAWLHKQVTAGMQVLITHPGKVETGLDLWAFPTLIFYQIPYSLTQLTQGKGRAWRLGQSERCEVLFPYYRSSMEHRALSLMADKTKADKILTGNEAAGSLVEQSTTAEGDFLSELARQAIEGAAVDDLGVLLERKQEGVWITNKEIALEEEEDERPAIAQFESSMQMPLFQ